jgi:hypothetical protein
MELRGDDETCSSVWSDRGGKPKGPGGKIRAKAFLLFFSNTTDFFQKRLWFYKTIKM